MLIAVMILALPSRLPLSPPRDLAGSPVSRLELDNYQAIYNDMAGRIASTEMPPQPKIVFTFELVVAPYPNISIKYFQRTGRFPWIYRIDDFADPNTVATLSDADFVVTITPIGGADTIPNVWDKFPASREAALIDARIRGSGRFAIIAGYHLQGAEIRLYQAAAANGQR